LIATVCAFTMIATFFEPLLAFGVSIEMCKIIYISLTATTTVVMSDNICRVTGRCGVLLAEHVIEPVVNSVFLFATMFLPSSENGRGLTLGSEDGDSYGNEFVEGDVKKVDSSGFITPSAPPFDFKL